MSKSTLGWSHKRQVGTKGFQARAEHDHTLALESFLCVEDVIITDGPEVIRRKKGASKSATAESWQVLMGHQQSLRDQLEALLSPKTSFTSLRGWEWGEAGNNFISEKMFWSWSQDTQVQGPASHWSPL